MALFGTIATLRAQAPQTAAFAGACDYVAELLRPDSAPAARLRAISTGETKKIDLGGGAFGLEQVYLTKPRAEGFFETHRKYVDLQVMIEGEEVMEVIDASRLTVKQDYNAERDLVIYGDTGAASQLRLAPGLAAIYFPADAHMGSLCVGATAALVRKVVVKIPVA
jgi:YhcH/YjgK/YiaL family protein